MSQVVHGYSNRLITFTLLLKTAASTYTSWKLGGQWPCNYTIYGSKSLIWNNALGWFRVWYQSVHSNYLCCFLLITLTWKTIAIRYPVGMGAWRRSQTHSCLYYPCQCPFYYFQEGMLNVDERCSKIMIMFAHFRHKSSISIVSRRAEIYVIS